MATKKVSVTVNFSTPGTQPPIYLAGSFSDPEWQPQEMQYTTDESNEHRYYKAVDVEEGKEYQYKFRVGEGNWWVLDEDAKIATDNIGNRNNLLAVPVSKHKEHIESPTPPKSPKMIPTGGAWEPAAVVNKAEPEVNVAENVKTQELAAAIDKAESEVKLVEGTESKTKESTAALANATDKTDPEAKRNGIIVPVMTEPDVQQHKEDTKFSTQHPNVAIDEPEVATKPTHYVEAIARDFPRSLEPEVKNDENTKATAQGSALLPPIISPELEDEEEIKDIKQDQDTPAIHKISLSDSDEREKKDNGQAPTQSGPPSPTLVVERIGSEPRYGDDFGAHATVGQKDAHLLRAQDAEPDYVVFRSETPRTPDIASVAAEVADSAAFLDREPPTPPISDEEAGRIGLRRLSHTPIPEVADTAAEVAEIAATLDKDAPVFKIDTPQLHIDVDGPEAMDSGASTPWEERAPRFSHECPTLPTGELRPESREHYEGTGPRDPFAGTVIDYNDPSIEEFPCEREAILEQVRSCQRRLSEDPVVVDGIPPSPVVGANRYPERADLPSPSPIMLLKHDDRSPSLDSIPEEHGDREELFPKLPSAMSHLKLNAGFDGVGSDVQDDRVTSIAVTKVSNESPPSGTVAPSKINLENQVGMDGSFVSPDPAHRSTAAVIHDNGRQIGDEDEDIIRNIAMPEQGPSITVLPATPGSSLKNRGSDPFSKPIDSAKATAIEEENGRGHLTSRKQPSPLPERPLTPSSMRGKDAKSKNFLRAFLNLVFVEWIGGLIMRLCGGGRNTLLALSLLALIIILPTLYHTA